MNKVNWKLWGARIASVLVSLFFGGMLLQDGGQAAANVSEGAGNILDFLPVAGEGLAALLGAALPFVLHRFFPQLDNAPGLPKEIQEAVASLVALATNPKEAKLQRRALQDVLDVAFVLAGSFTNSADVKAALLHVSQLIHDALGPGVQTPPAPVPVPAEVPVSTLAEAMK